jgi:AcrR family transcriptional regulator
VDRDAEIDMLREALRRRVEKTSVRQVAAEVKMSHGGVYNLISGDAAPYGKTLTKLRAWYLDQTARGEGTLNVEAGRYLVEQLLATVPSSLRAAAGAEMLDKLEVLFERFEVPLPAWVDRLRKELREEAGG